ncbi:MAG: hypothetical protein FRX49_02824 [Trebouxia sp. A1-2]|nr:MAG: hypothetical protein FRX49_02824 [Trebouxia sp. A1-2]
MKTRLAAGRLQLVIQRQSNAWPALQQSTQYRAEAGHGRAYKAGQSTQSKGRAHTTGQSEDMAELDMAYSSPYRGTIQAGRMACGTFLQHMEPKACLAEQTAKQATVIVLTAGSYYNKNKEEIREWENAQNRI